MTDLQDIPHLQSKYENLKKIVDKQEKAYNLIEADIEDKDDMINALINKR